MSHAVMKPVSPREATQCRGCGPMTGMAADVATGQSLQCDAGLETRTSGNEAGESFI